VICSGARLIPPHPLTLLSGRIFRPIRPVAAAGEPYFSRGERSNPMSPWIVVPTGVVLVLIVLYMALLTLLMVFAKYFARGPASGSDLVAQSLRPAQLATFERAFDQSRDATFATTPSNDAGLTRRIG
jgi:hypothetical protein